MEKTLNKAELRGIVGADPKVVELENGVKLIKFSIATHETFKTREGTLKEETMWHNVIGWYNKSMPEFEAIRKGMLVEVLGKLRYSRYKNKEGEERFVTEIVAQKLSIAI